MSTKRFGAALILGAAACVSCESSTAPLPENTLSGAMALSTSASSFYSRGAAATGNATVTTPAADPGGCPFDGASWFVCPDQKFLGRLIRRKYRLFDRDAQVLGAFDSRTVDAIQMVIDDSGTTTSTFGSDTTTISGARHSDHTVAGLLSRTRIADGVATDSSLIARKGGSSGSSTTTINATTTTSQVVLPLPHSEQVWPSSGSVVTHLNLATNNGSAVALTLTMTFDGSDTATLVMSGLFGATTTCKLKATQNSFATTCTTSS